MTNAAQANKHDNDTLDMHSPNLVDDNVQKIMALFPNCITESEDENGNLKKAVDFDLLRQELSQSLVEGGQERYRLDWPGKRQAILEANSPIAKTLRPARDESVNFDTTENLFIEGDNLDALKLLQESYLGQVKMIYIDPPYNTGSDFIYKDNFTEDTQVFLERSEKIDEEGNRLIDNYDLNSETNGRFHSDWLTMMYSRLKLARNLLKEDGLILVNCDENEFSNINKLLTEIFGKKNKIYTFVWHLPRGINAGHISKAHEYIVVFAKNKDKLNLFYAKEVKESIERCNKKIDVRHPASVINFPKGIRYEGKDQVIKGRIDGSESIEIIGELVFENSLLKEDVSLKAGWTMKNMIEDWLKGRKVYDTKGQEILEFFFKENGKLYSRKVNNFYSPKSVLTECKDSQFARLEIENLVGSQDIFDYPKPTVLLKRLISFVIKDKHEIVLDFFAGSSTTAHAVMQLNAEDNGNRKFVMVQLDESIDSDKQKDAYKFCMDNNFEPNIAEISKERIRRAGQKILADNQDKDGIEDLDIGFRVLKIDSTNMKDVYYTPDEYSQAELDNLESHIKEDRTGEDLLFQVMLDWGVPLSLPIEVKEIQGSSVYYVGIDSLVACFDTLTTDLIDEISKNKPLKFVSSELAIAHDQDKTNIKARFAQLSPDTQVKFI